MLKPLNTLTNLKNQTLQLGNKIHIMKAIYSKFQRRDRFCRVSLRRWKLSNSMIFLPGRTMASFASLRPNPFQGMSWYSNGGVVKCAVWSCTLSIKPTVFWVVEGTFHFLTSWEVTADRADHQKMVLVKGLVVLKSVLEFFY